MPGLTPQCTMTMRRHSRFRRILLGGSALTVALAGFMATEAQAADWTGTASNDWFTAGNWNPAAVPTSANDVTINNSATPNPAGIGAAGAVANSVTLGSAAGQFGTLNIAGGTLTTSGTANPGFAVGDFGTGTLTISGGGVLTAANSYVALDPGSHGTATVT